MAIQVAFFGNSHNIFSSRFYEILMNTPCSIVSVVDVPTSGRSTTNPDANAGGTDFLQDASGRGAARFAPADPNEGPFVDAIRALKPDLLLAVGYTKRLKRDLLSVPQIVSVNVHASLLPAYRGRHPVFWALRHGERFSGLSIHAMDEQLDTGDVLYQVVVRTRRNDTVSSLYDRIIARGVELIPRLIGDAARGAVPLRKQASEGASYFSSPSEDDFRIDWLRPAEEQRRWIVTTPGRCFVEIEGKRIFLIDAERVANPDNDPAGTLLSLGRTAGTVAMGRDALRIGKIQSESLEQTMVCFCRQIGLRVGRRLTQL